MSKGKEAADECLTDTESTRDLVFKVYDEVTAISDLTTQISVASEEQSAVSREISANITRVNDVSQNNLKQAEIVESESIKIEQIAKALTAMGMTFGS